MKLDRRQFLLTAAMAGVVRGQRPRPYSEELPDMLVDYFTHRLDEQARRSDAERAGIRTLSQLRMRNRFVREKVREMIGVFPPQCPLASRVAKTIQREGYQIENVLFQSRPDYWIAANVHVPTKLPGPFPAIVFERGHFNPERMSADYQQLYFDLVTNGFIVLSFDPVGQGERWQHYASGEETFDDALSPTLEHCIIGSQLSLIGENAAGHFVWDGIRAIDYLEARTDVRRDGIGFSDHTDTGWNAIILCALDERIHAAAVHAHGRGRQWPLDRLTWNLTEDPEQQLFPAAKLGIDRLDIIAAFAPRPLLTLIEDQTGDFDATATYLTKSYRLSEAANAYRTTVARPTQDWPKDLRLETVRWFRRWLRGQSGVVEESNGVIEPYAALKVTAEGSFRESRVGQPIYFYIRSRAAGLTPEREPSAEGLTKLRAEIRQLLGLPRKETPLAPREVSLIRLRGYSLNRVEFLSEPGVYVSTQIYRPDKPNTDCIVYVAGDVTRLVLIDDDDPNPPVPDDDNPAYEFAREAMESGTTVVAVDVRGIGLTQPAAAQRDYRGRFEHLHNSDVALANMAWTLGDSLFAMRVRDLLRAVEFASQFGSVHLAGVDMGALWALYAAAVEPRVLSIAVQGGLGSYRMLTDHARHAHAISQFTPNILTRFDLPHVAGALAPRRFVVLDPMDHMKVALDAKTANLVYGWTRQAYTAAAASDQFQVVIGETLSRYAIAK